MVRTGWGHRTGAAVVAALTAASVGATRARAYDVNVEREARPCELYVDSLGIGHFRYLESQQQFLDAYLRVNEHELVDLQGDHILTAGAAVEVRSITAALGDDGKPALDMLDFGEKVFAERIGPGSYQLRFAFEERSHPQRFLKELKSVAFFVDVKRDVGRVERLWLRHGGANFTMDAVFGDKPGSEMSIGIGAVRYPPNDSPIYAQKHACSG
jgi:hypothetical protein